MLTRFSAVFFKEIKQPLRLHKACASNLYFFFRFRRKWIFKNFASLLKLRVG